VTATPWPGSALRVTRVIRFNAFDMNCVAHQSPGLWRHPRDQSWRYKDLSYWTELAKLLERGRFDGLFIADVLGTYDAYPQVVTLAVVARRPQP
jgi:alkanesulfonate monooxygenase SsuD/methylene tetrahydromethanopterin reductase-like flavin-dependent oxidoreductase (luciferase family)